MATAARSRKTRSTKSSDRVIRKSHVDGLAEELAEAAGITPAQARKVLKVLHADKMVENSQALQRILGDPLAVNALGWGQDHAAELSKLASPRNVSLENLRIAVKPAKMPVSIIV